MKIIKYVCNVCGNTHNKESAKTNILSCYFSNLNDFKLMEYNAETDRHICKTCIASILKSLDLTHPVYHP